MEHIAQGAVSLTGNNVVFAALVRLWFAGFASAIVDNIPAVATLIMFAQGMGPFGLALTGVLLDRVGGAVTALA